MRSNNCLATQVVKTPMGDAEEEVLVASMLFCVSKVMANCALFEP